MLHGQLVTVTFVEDTRLIHLYIRCAFYQQKDLWVILEKTKKKNEDKKNENQKIPYGLGKYIQYHLFQWINCAFIFPCITCYTEEKLSVCWRINSLNLEVDFFNIGISMGTNCMPILSDFFFVFIWVWLSVRHLSK